MIRPRVLVIAEAANPEWVSVPLVGWSLAHALREVADVHLVTQLRNRAAILRAGLVEGRDFTALDTESVARPMHRIATALTRGKGGWTTQQAIGAVSYHWFEWLLWQRFGPQIRAGAFDIVHRVTPLSPTVSSGLATKCKVAGVPFILGPLNGGVPWPRAFDAARRQEREWLSYVRGGYKLLPGRNRTLAASAAILVGSRHTESEIPARFRDRTIYLPENGIDPERFDMTTPPAAPGGPMRAAFVGRMVPYKGPDMLIEAALPLLRAGKLHLDMIGNGPILSDLKVLAEREGVTSAITFHGWLDHKSVQGVLGGCNLLSFPSIREFGGGVVLEAMALGIPALIVDYAGPGELVTPGTGFKVPLGTREEIVRNFGAELQRLCENPQELVAAGASARTRVEMLFTWSRKAGQIARIYDWVLGKEGVRPDPMMATAAK